MKSNLSTRWAILLGAVVFGSGLLAAQEKKTFEAPVPPPPVVQYPLISPEEADEDVLMYLNDGDEGEAPDMAWFGTGPDVMYFNSEADLNEGPMQHYSASRRIKIHGDNRPWLGVFLSDLDSEQAKAAKLAGENGVLVKDVREKSPAAQAGLMKDDVIVEFAGEKIRSATQLSRLVRETPVGRSVPIVVSRAGKTQTLTAKLESRHDGPLMGMGGIQAGPEPFTVPLPGSPRPGKKFEFFVHRGARLGISADDLTPQLAEFFGVKQGKGVLVREVIVGSAAEKAGLKAGDVIIALDGQEIASAGKLRRALAGGKEETEKRKVTLTIVRDKREQSVSVELDSPDKAMPKPAMRAEIELDVEHAMKAADEAAAHAKEIGLAWRERAKTFQTEWQTRLQQEMEKLRKELPKLEEEIQKQKASMKAQLERI